MNLVYRPARLFRVLSFGLYNKVFTLTQHELCVHGLRPKWIPITQIERLAYEIKSVRSPGQPGVSSYFYVLYLKSGSAQRVGYSTLPPRGMQHFLKQLLQKNPKIATDDKVKEFLEADLTPPKLRFDFQNNAKNLWAKDMDHAQKHPGRDAVMGFSAVLLLFGIPVLSGLLGENWLFSQFGPEYPEHRLWLMLIAGLSVGMAFTNLIAALASAYLGHTVTVICLLLGLGCFLFAVGPFAT